MYCISDEQVDFILDDLRVRGIFLESIRESLLDHICILIEELLEAGGDFFACYDAVIVTFYKNELREIEEEARLLADMGRGRVVGRNLFFLLLLLVFMGPFIGYDIWWMVQASAAVRWPVPLEVWGGSFVLSLFPLFILLVLYFTPERFDPLIPRRSRVLLGGRGLIRVLAGNKILP